MVRFTTKKIDSMTLGERMKKIREDRRLSLVEISKNTKIQVRYLQYLEEGDYSKLPAEVYVKGFLRNYAVFMGVNEIVLLKQYDRERKIQQHINKNQEIDKTSKPIKFSSFVLTPKVVAIFSGFFLVIGGFLYLYKGIDNFVSIPRLVILKPIDGVAVDGRSVRVNGIAEKDSKVFINDQPIIVNEKGEFSEDVGLGEGLNKITVIAKNKFDKEAVQSVSVNANYQNIIQSQEGENQNNQNLSESQKEFELELYVKENPTWISVMVDGNLIYSGILAPESTQKFKAKEKVEITSGKGNDTYVKINGKNEEVLDSSSQVARGIIFTPDGRAS